MGSSPTLADKYCVASKLINASASCFERGVSAVAYAVHSASARLPRIGFRFLHRLFSSGSRMVDKDGTGLGLLVRLPSVEEIAHDHHDIAPAMDVLLTPLRIKSQ